MLGTMLVAAKVLARNVGPSTAPITMTLPSPVIRLTSVHAATVAEPRIAVGGDPGSQVDDLGMSAHDRSRRRATSRTTKAATTAAAVAPVAAPKNGVGPTCPA